MKKRWRPNPTKCVFVDEIVQCDKRYSDCEKCGWNPVVAEERLRKFKENYKEDKKVED